MIRAFVVDDERIVAQWFAALLNKTSQVEVEKIINNPLEVISEIKKLKPDVVFLDIEMPEVTGLELAEQISSLEEAPEIVFVTAYDEYALQAFRVNALDYMMKPIDPREVDRVIEKIQKRRVLQNNTKETICIRALGGFSIISGIAQEPVKWSTSKCEELFAYMLFQSHKIISKWEIIDVLWPDKEDKKGETNLRTTVCRLNQTFKKYRIDAKIKAEKNVYLLEINNFSVDAFKLENIEEEWQKRQLEDNNIMGFFSEIYPGNLFGEWRYEWSQPLQVYYERLFIQWGKQYIDRRIEKQEDELLTYKLLEYLLEITPFHEELHERVMQLIFKMEGKKSLKNYYERFESMMFEEIGASPKKEIQYIYKKMME